MSLLKSLNKLKCCLYQEQRKDFLRENCLKRRSYNLTKSNQRVSYISYMHLISYVNKGKTKNCAGRFDDGLCHVVPYMQGVVQTSQSPKWISHYGF